MRRASLQRSRACCPLLLGLALVFLATDAPGEDGSAQALRPQVLSVPGAEGPRGPSCREALGLPPAGAASTPSPRPSPEPLVLPLAPELDPDQQTAPPLEGPPEVLARVGDVLRRGEAGDRVRLSFFGASHTGADLWTGHIRRELQDRWGDSGHGFILPAALYRGYRGQDVNLCRSSGWRSDWVGRKNGRGDGLLGFAGMSVSSSSPDDFGWIQTTVENPHGRKVARFDLYTLAQPEGGSLRVEVDGLEAGIVSTRSAELGLQLTRIEVPDGPHRLLVAPTGDGEVRIFGVSLERPGGGALVDAMGIRGRQARDWLEWEPRMALQGHRSLDPDLVVLAYGTNEAADTSYSPEAYRQDLDSVLSRLRESVPVEVPCVLAGPSDRARKVKGSWEISERTALVAQVQRELAPKHGCAFWDWQAATGGPGSIMSWYQAEPRLASRDLIHFTRAGYERLAEMFLEALDATRP